MSRCSLHVVAVALVVSLCSSFALAQTPVTIPDPGLEAAIRDRLVKPTGQLYREELAAIAGLLDAGNRGISNLDGIQWCTSVTSLDLSQNSITNISRLSGLTALQALNFSNNSVSDISVLSGLTNLQWLYFEYNSVVSVSPLSTLSSLQSIGAGFNSIVNISPLSGLTSLTNLNLYDNSISNVTPLSGLTGLSVLYLDYNSIVDVSPLAGLTGLGHLGLKGNLIVDIRPLLGLASTLDTFNIFRNRLDVTCPDSPARVVIQAFLDQGCTVAWLPQDTSAPDAEPPSVVCSGVTVNTDPGKCYASSVALGTPAATDNCAVASLSNDAPAQFPKGDTSVTWTATDTSGNVATGIQTVKVQDGENPWITCPASISTVRDAGANGAVVNYAVTYGDNCPGATLAQTAGLPSGSLFPLGTTTNAFVVTDAAGRTAACSFSVNVTPRTYTLTTSVLPTGGGTVTGAGTYTENTNATVKATAASGYRFDKWSGAVTVTTNPKTLVMTADKSVTANFVKTYKLSASVVPAGCGTVSGAGTYDKDRSAQVTAIPAAGFRFVKWSGDLGGKAPNPVTVFMSGNKHVIANFVKACTLTASVSPAGAGTVTGAGTYDAGGTATLTATAAPGYRFTTWSGDAAGATNPMQVTMTADKTVTANFIKTYRLSTSVVLPGVGQSGGTVELTGGGKNTVSGEGTYDSGSTATVTATAAAGYRFTSWSGDAAGATNPTTVTMTANKTATANFIRTYTLTTSVSPTSAGAVTGAGTYDSGSTATVTATAAAGYRFASWSGDASGETNSATVTMAANKTATANFIQTYTLTTSVSPTSAGAVTGAGTYDSGSTATITATAAAGYRFAGWSDALTGLANPATVAMTGDKSVDALFVPEGWAALWWAPSPPAAGDVYAIANIKPGQGWRPSTDPSAIRRQTPGLVGVYQLPLQVFVEAVAFDGYRFTGWSGGATGTVAFSAVIMKSGDMILGATFVRTFAMMTACDPADAGSIYRSPWYPRYDENAVVTLTAAPRPGYVFDHWSWYGAPEHSNPWTLIVAPPEGISTMSITAVFRKS